MLNSRDSFSSCHFPRRRPSIPSDAIIHYRGSLLNLSGHAIAYSTDVVRHREAAGTVPVVLKVVPVTDAAFSGITMDRFLCASFFAHQLFVRWMCAIQKVSKAVEHLDLCLTNFGSLSSTLNPV